MGGLGRSRGLLENVRAALRPSWLVLDLSRGGFLGSHGAIGGVLEVSSGVSGRFFLSGGCLGGNIPYGIGFWIVWRCLGDEVS